MLADTDILNRLIGIEAMAHALLNDAAMLRQKLQAGGLPATSRKGKENVQMVNKAKTFYNKKHIRTSLTKTNNNEK